jgi:hypothetical protein
MATSPSTTTGQLPQRQYLLCLLGIIVAVFAAYGATLSATYVWEDWNTYLAPNPAQQLRNLPGFFFTSAQEGFSVSHTTPYYRPIAVVLFGLEYALVGANPFWSHFISCALHAANACMLFAIAHRLAPASIWPALAGSLIFAVHPALTESVAYLGGRGDLICGLFMGSSLLAYLRFRQDNRPWLLVLSQLLLALALLTKEMAIVMPALILLYELGSPQRRQLLFALIPAAVVAAYLLVRAQVLPIQSWTATPLQERFYTALYVVGQYLATLTVPQPVKTLYDVTAKFSVHQPEVLLMLVVITGYLVVIAVAFVRRQRLLVALLLGTLVLLFPVSNLPAMILPSPMAARYLYIPAQPFCLAVGVIFSLLAARHPLAQRRTPGVVLAVCCLALAVITATTSRKWQNNDVFFAAMVQEAPDQPLSYKFAGNYLGKTGRGAEMMQLKHQAFEVTKQRQLALAEELLKYRQYDRAIFELSRIVNADEDPRITRLLATIRERQGKRP